MKLLLITLIAHGPDPVTGELKSTTERFREVVETAVLAEELGFDGFGVGERHERPFLSSSPPVVLSHIAARTSTIRLFTAVTTLALLDPVRAYEDYATLDHLSNGRLELIIGKGNGVCPGAAVPRHARGPVGPQRRGVRAVPPAVAGGEGRLERAVPAAAARGRGVVPRPLQRPIQVWHGSATSKASVELAARWGDPIFSANVTNPIEPYAELIDHYRERWAHYGRDPKDALVGAGSAGYRAVTRAIFDAPSQRKRTFAVMPAPSSHSTDGAR